MYNILGIIWVLCIIWVIYDVWTKQKMSTGDKVLWTVLALLFGTITAVIYYFMKKK